MSTVDNNTPMLQKIVSLTEKFVSIQSDPDNTEALDEILSLSLAQLEGCTVERFERNGVKSALVYNAPTRPDTFKVLFNIHLDVIPGKKDQYTPRIEDDKLYGVGAMDMKANAACAILAFAEVAATVDHPIAVQLVTDEEVGGFDGTQYQVEEGVRADFVIATEPTNFDIVNAAKGVLWIKVTATGETAHGAYPWRGDNAIWKMNTFLNALKEKHPIPDTEEWVTTVNVSSMQTSNEVYNKIPDECTVGLDIRFTPDDADTILSDVKTLLPEGCSLDVITHEPALHTDSDNTYLQALSEVAAKVLQTKTTLRPAQGTSDARHFAKEGCNGIEFGPVGDGIGSDYEWVSIPSLSQYYDILKKFLLSLP